MSRPKINSEETFGSLKKENKELRKALSLFWKGSKEIDSYIEDGGLEPMSDSDTWYNIRRICHKYQIPGDYVFDGVLH